MNMNELREFVLSLGWYVEKSEEGTINRIYVKKMLSDDMYVYADLEFRNGSWASVAACAKLYAYTFDVMQEFIDEIQYKFIDKIDSFEQLRPIWEHEENSKKELEALATALDEKANKEEVK